VLAVPRGAVEAQGGRRYVFVVKKNQLGVGKSILESGRFTWHRGRDEL